PVIPVLSPSAVARHCGDDSAWRNLADAIVAGIPDEQVAGPVHRYAPGPGQLRVGGWPVIPGIPLCASARHRGDDSVGGNPAGAMVTGVRDEQVAGPIHRYATRSVQLRAGGWPPI